MLQNRLAETASPYLLQHADNPVAWQPWDSEALRLAREQGKPILLSIGYAACHWCHVMAHESFEDTEIAALINEAFIPIKVDREERPDLDMLYQQALAVMGQQGGWPLTMFLTPAGDPFWGGTYFPPRARWGRPGFADILAGLAGTWANEPHKVEQNRAALVAAVSRLSAPPEVDDEEELEALTPAHLDRMAKLLAGRIDMQHGGIGDAPKFPNTGILTLLWRGAWRSNDNALRQAVITSLVHMADGGIYDHLGGGFARYSTDREWLVPHFEKMLYDNALLVDLMVDVWRGEPASTPLRPLLAERIEETVIWLAREMATDGGAFAATIDADSEGEEGAFYLWDKAEIDGLLGPAAAGFARVYGVTRHGNFEGRTILGRLADPGQRGTADEEAELARCRGLLLAARDGRIRPATDDKILADWNGLMIAALARAAFTFNRPDWLAMAEKAWNFIITHMMTPEGKLRHSWREGRPGPDGFLEDYAAMARAAVVLSQVTITMDGRQKRERYLQQAKQWLEIVEHHFAAPAPGGYYMTPADGEPLFSRSLSAADAATPSGNGLLMEVFASLHALTGVTEWEGRARQLVSAFLPQIAQNFFPYASLINATEQAMMPVQLVIVGKAGTPDLLALIEAVRACPFPAWTLTIREEEEALPAGHPAAGKGLVGGKAALYVCEGQTCLAPLTDPAAVAGFMAYRPSGWAPAPSH